jgi:hypothetical protein
MGPGVTEQSQPKSLRRQAMSQPIYEPLPASPLQAGSPGLWHVVWGNSKQLICYTLTSPGVVKHVCHAFSPT